MHPFARLTLALASLSSVAADAAPSTDPAGVQILYFMASWCLPCKQMEPLVAGLAREGHAVQTIDVDQHDDLTEKHHIDGIPAFVAFANGKEIGRRIGTQSESTMREWISSLARPAASAERRTPEEPLTLPTEIAGAAKVEPLLRVTYTVSEEKAEALVDFLEDHSDVEFEADVEDGTLRITAAPEVQHALGPFLRDVLNPEESPAERDDQQTFAP